jgi:soluble lytic murein transglycosylase-like protein
MSRYLGRVLTVQSLAALALGVSTATHADLWGFVDENGTAHIATRKQDDRYQLFLRGGTEAVAPDATAAAAQSARAAFELTPLFQRTAGSPNLHRFEALIHKHAALQKLDPALVKAVIAVESSFEPDSVSGKGAVGLMQIIPETGARYGVVGDAKRSVEQKLRDPAINLGVGTRYLRDLLAMFENDLELALAAYNAGEQAVKRYQNTVPPFVETQEYVKLVQQFLSFYRPPPPAPATRVRVVIPGRRHPLMLPGDAAQ